MKSLHRVKTLAAYDGAKEVIRKELTYPGYVLLKEATRGALSYIAEDALDMEISDKTKLDKLIELVPETLVTEGEKQVLMKLVKAEKQGLSAITSMDIDELREIKGIVKSLICVNLDERV